MTRRYQGKMNGQRYLANTNPTKLEVHDLDNEQTNCQIGKIIDAHHEFPYNSLEEAHKAGYDNCAYCIGGSTR